ncbi:MAG: dihydropteroate synthase, partial [Verrucomicrobiota bacterium]
TARLAALGRPVVLGLSRKSFLGHLTGAAPRERLPGALAASAWCARQGAAVFRTHDVAPTVHALRVVAALAGGAP